MLPFEPEPIEKLRARYEAALVKLWDAPTIAGALEAGHDPLRPGDMRENVFDLHGQTDGSCIRLIISRDRTPDDRTCIHIAGSLNGAFLDITKRLAEIELAMRAVTIGKLGFITLAGMSEAGVFHFIRYEPSPKPEGA